MSGSANLHAASALPQALLRARPVLAPHVRTLYRGRQYRVLSALRKDDAAARQPSKEERPGVPSVVRRTALLGAAVPCLCAMCSGGGAAKAAGRSRLYDKYFATAMRYGMGDYEAVVRPVKNQLFVELIRGLLAQDAAAASADGGGGAPAAFGGARRVLEVGVGTGPNFPFYTAALAQALSRPTGAPETPLGSAPAASAPAAAVEHLGGQPPAPEEALQVQVQAPTPLLRIVGLDPNAEMLRFAGEAAKAAGMRLTTADGSSSSGSGDGGGSDAAAGPSAGALADVSLVQGSVEALPFGDGGFDAAVVTLVMCSVPNPAAALGELRRVVRPGGRLLIIEHVAAGEGRPGLRLAQSLLTPLQRLLADGCRLNRDTAAALRAAGWRAGEAELRSFDLEGLSILAPHIAGVLVR